MIILSRMIVFITMLVAYWSAIRVAGFTIFDLMVPITLLLAWATPSHNPAPGDRDSNQLVASQLIMLASVIPSAFMTSNVGDHFQKWAVIMIAMSGMLATLCVLRNRGVLSYDGVRLCLCASGTISSIFVILQGAFFMFRWISPSLNDSLAWGDLLRPTGLAEHPIETGACSAVSTILGASLLMKRVTARRSMLLNALLATSIAVNVASFAYSASLTALLGLGVGLIALLVIAGRMKILAVGAAVLIFAAVPALFGSNNLLSDRVTKLSESGGDYTTVQSRRDQLGETLSRIDVPNFFLGHGYSEDDLPEGLEIHNALLASDYHFGVLGLLSQFSLLLFVLSKFRSNYSREMKATLAAILIIFLAEFLTGPVFARRSNWIALLAVAIYMPRVPRPVVGRRPVGIAARRQPAVQS